MASITSLQSDHENARRRTDRSSELIKESLQRYGAARSIVIDEDNRILAGNGTIEGAKAAGIKNVRIIEFVSSGQLGKFLTNGSQSLKTLHP